RLAVDLRDRARAREAFGDALAPPDHLGVEGVARPAPVAHRPRVHDAADARPVAGERDPPEPAVLEDVDADVALVRLRGPPGAAPVGEERDLAEVRDSLASPECLGDLARPASRVDEEARAHLGALAVALSRDRHAVGVEGNGQRRRRLADVDTE